MTIQILKNRFIGDVQADFERAYPFLRLDFYKKANGKPAESKLKLSKSIPLSVTGMHQEGELSVHDAMTVGELEEIFNNQFGAAVQVSRRSGSIWLETTMTDNWTLKQQNDHGRELSEPVKKAVDDGVDYD